MSIKDKIEKYLTGVSIESKIENSDQDCDKFCPNYVKYFAGQMESYQGLFGFDGYCLKCESNIGDCNSEHCAEK